MGGIDTSFDENAIRFQTGRIGRSQQTGALTPSAAFAQPVSRDGQVARQEYWKVPQEGQESSRAFGRSINQLANKIRELFRSKRP